MSSGKTVEDSLVALIAKIGEKITIGKSETIENKNGYNFTYQHSVIKDNVSKLGVIVSLEVSEVNDKVKSFGKQLSMHIAASNPLALNPDDIQKEIVEKEQKIIAEQEKKEKELEYIKIKEWEEKFDKEQKMRDEKEKLRDEKIRRRELEEIRLKEGKDIELKEELTSRLENFEVKQTTKN